MTTAVTLTAMCLLVVVSRLDPTAPLVVGANRDERLERPASAMTVLSDAGPASWADTTTKPGGTWLAVNEHGVVAGLTNRPVPGRARPHQALARRAPVGTGPPRRRRVRRRGLRDTFCASRTTTRRGSWSGTGTSLYALDMTGGARAEAPHRTRTVRVEELGPGVHVLENNPLHGPSPKASHVRALLGTDRRPGAGT